MKQSRTSKKLKIVKLKENYGEPAKIKNNFFNPTGTEKTNVKKLPV